MSNGFFDLVDDFSAESLLAPAEEFYDFFGSPGIVGETARVFAAGLRGECMSVRVPGLPFGEFIAQSANWWGGQFSEVFSDPARGVRYLHECVTSEIQEFVGVTHPDACSAGDKPRLNSFTGRSPDGFLVQAPGWADIFQFNNESVFDERSRRARALDYAEALKRSPTPPSLREIGTILTTLDDLQDEAATLAVALMLVEKLAGRAIPGVGTVATIADALNIIQALALPATGTALPGRKAKRLTANKARTTGSGYEARVQRSRRVNEFERVATSEQLARKPVITAPEAGFRFTMGDALQALQASDSMFGIGISLGPLMGFIQDAFWLGIRGGELQIPGRAVDPFGFTPFADSNCNRSPRLEDIHPLAYPVLASEALSLWSNAGRVAPYLDLLGEQALASVLYGMRLSESVLGGWLRSGAWVGPVGRAVGRLECVRGGVEAHDTYRLPADQWVGRTAPAITAAVNRAIGSVPHRGRQALYESLVGSIGWGLAADLEPESLIRDKQLRGPVRDAMLALEANRIPVFDLDDR